MFGKIKNGFGGIEEKIENVAGLVQAFEEAVGYIEDMK